MSFALQSFAQQQTQTEEEAKPKSGTRRQLATIIFAGLGGAVLGLSTLSFYGRPQDKLSNIAIGFAIGVIGGTIYVTYGAATKPREFYGSIDDHNKFQMPQRPTVLQAQSESAPPILGMNFQF